MKKKLMPIWLALAGVLAGCATHYKPAPVTLKAAFQNDFLIGAALNPSQFCESNRAVAALVKQQFNSISPENILKWEKIHPAPGRYDFTLADRYVNFGVENKMFIVGHNLVWHEQTPPWVFQNEQGQPVSREVLLARMREHIFAVVGRYRGKIGGWDVVNEALNEDGTLRQSPWRKIIGEDYLLQAYQFAHEADPAAELYYNDYSLENPAKRDGALALISKLQAQGVKISGIGLQGHYNLDFPTLEQLDATITAFARLGMKVMITELDVDVLPRATRDVAADVSKNVQRSENLNPYSDGLPDALQRQLAERYADLFRIFVLHRDVICRVTFWGVTDGDSWLNDWPVKGRTNYPMLFDRTGDPKPAFDAAIQTAKSPAN